MRARSARSLRSLAQGKLKPSAAGARSRNPEPSEGPQEASKLPEGAWRALQDDFRTLLVSNAPLLRSPITDRLLPEEVIAFAQER